MFSLSPLAGRPIKVRWGRGAWKRLLSTETKVSVLSRISRKRQSFRSDSSNWKGPLFLPLVPIPPSYIPVFYSRPAGGSSLAFDSKGERDCEESIMELFKFVSNIEISFMPGKLIIEVYRRTRRRLRMPGIVRDGRGIGEEREMNFLFFARLLFPIARDHQDSSSFSFALVHFAARERGRLFCVA